MKQRGSDGLKLNHLQESDDKDEMSESESEEPSEEPSEECISRPSSDSDNDNDAESHSKSSSGQTTIYPLNEPTVSKTVRNRKNTTQEQENAGSSERKRRSRWDEQPEAEDDGRMKQRKTRWADDDSQLKTTGCVKIPEFVKPLLAGVILDPEIQEMTARLAEINRKLQETKFLDDRPEEERSPSPPPVYDNLGIRTNTREVRFHEKLIREKQAIMSKLIQKNPSFVPPSKSKPHNLYRKLYIPFKEYPGYNFIGLILGPRGNTQKRMEKETGAKILLRGKGSEREPKSQRQDRKANPSEDEDLHVLIEADTQESLDAAVAMVEKLLVPVGDGMSKLKLAQLRELAELNGTLRSETTCIVGGGHEHAQNSCLSRNSMFKMDFSCQVCGDGRHATAGCPLTASEDDQQRTFLAELGVSGPASSAPSSIHPALSTLPSRGLSSTAVFPPSKPIKEIDDSNLYVGFLPPTMDDNRLIELFSPFGRLDSVKLLKDKTTGLHKGCGFVKYYDSANAAKAIEHMNGYRIDGKTLAVRVAGRPPEAPLNSGLARTTATSLLPKYPGPLYVLPQDDHMQSSWPGPPGSMLPEPNASLPKHEPEHMSQNVSISGQFPASDMLSYRVPISSSGLLAQCPGNQNSLPDHAWSTDSFSRQLPSSSYGLSSQRPVPLPSSLAQFPRNWSSSLHFEGQSNTFGGLLSSTDGPSSCQNSFCLPTSQAWIPGNRNSLPSHVAYNDYFGRHLPSSHGPSSVSYPISESTLLGQFPGKRSYSPSHIERDNSLGVPPSSYEQSIPSPTLLTQFSIKRSSSPSYVGGSNSVSRQSSTSYGSSLDQYPISSRISLAQFPGNLSSSTASPYQSRYTTEKSLSAQVHFTSSLSSSQKTPTPTSTLLPEQDKKVIETDYDKILSKVAW